MSMATEKIDNQKFHFPSLFSLGVPLVVAIGYYLGLLSQGQPDWLLIHNFEVNWIKKVISILYPYYQ